jgi:hypothetical protein
MGKTMTLLEAVRDLDSLDDEGTIYAAEPWTPGSRVMIARQPDIGGHPAETQKLGLKYFLEIFIALELLEGWEEGVNAEATVQQKCARLIEYAINDA